MAKSKVIPAPKFKTQKAKADQSGFSKAQKPQAPKKSVTKMSQLAFRGRKKG